MTNQDPLDSIKASLVVRREKIEAMLNETRNNIYSVLEITIEAFYDGFYGFVKLANAVIDAMADSKLFKYAILAERLSSCYLTPIEEAGNDLISCPDCCGLGETCIPGDTETPDEDWLCFACGGSGQVYAAWQQNRDYNLPADRCFICHGHRRPCAYFDDVTPDGVCNDCYPYYHRYILQRQV